MDEDDFRFKKRSKSKPKKRQTKEKPAWELKILGQVRSYVLREPEDFLLKKPLVEQLGHSETNVGQCLVALVREGILVYKAVDPDEYETVYIGNGPFSATVSWHEGQWVWGKPIVFKHKGFGNYRRNWGIRRDSRKHRSKRDVERANRKDPPVPVASKDWDGKAYFIIRDQEFKEACKKAGMPTDPKSDWICPKCGKSCSYDELQCQNYGVTPPCEYRRPNANHWPPPFVKLGTCGQCGAKLEPGQKTHSKLICNTNVVRYVMDE